MYRYARAYIHAVYTYYTNITYARQQQGPIYSYICIGVLLELYYIIYKQVVYLYYLSVNMFAARKRNPIFQLMFPIDNSQQQHNKYNMYNVYIGTYPYIYISSYDYIS